MTFVFCVYFYGSTAMTFLAHGGGLSPCGMYSVADGTATSDPVLELGLGSLVGARLGGEVLFIVCSYLPSIVLPHCPGIVNVPPFLLDLQETSSTWSSLGFPFRAQEHQHMKGGGKQKVF